MGASLEVIQFLANSPNRIRVFAELVDGPATQRDLQAAVDASRSTVARVLDEADERRWVEPDGNQYRLTRLGEKMVTDFLTYLDTIEGRCHLGEMVHHIPPPVFTIDFRYLREAEIIELTTDNPMAPFTRSLDRFERSTEYRGLNHTSLPEHAEVLRDRFADGAGDFEQIFEGAFIQTLLSDPVRTERWTDFEDGVLVYDGVVPINMHIVDGVVLIWLGEERGKPIGILECENAGVLTWAESLYEEYRADARPLDPAIYSES